MDGQGIGVILFHSIIRAFSSKMETHHRELASYLDRVRTAPLFSPPYFGQVYDNDPSRQALHGFTMICSAHRFWSQR